MLSTTPESIPGLVYFSPRLIAFSLLDATCLDTICAFSECNDTQAIAVSENGLQSIIKTVKDVSCQTPCPILSADLHLGTSEAEQSAVALV